MRINKLLQTTLAVATISAASLVLSACSKSTPDISAENIVQQEDTLTEQHDGGSVSWSVTPDGEVKAAVKTADGKAVEKPSGSLAVKAASSTAAPADVKLTYNEKTGLLEGNIPKLDNDMTEVKYTIEGSTKPIKGALHLPSGGTKELNANAKAAAELNLDGKKGPNGGWVQVVGDDIVEIVADKKTGTVRVYLLDKDLKAIKITGKKEIKLAVAGNGEPQVVVMTADPGGLYFTGKVSVKTDPVKLTVDVATEDVHKVVLVNYTPGVVVVVGAAAPVVPIVVVSSWDVAVGVDSPSVVIVDHHHHYKGKGKGHGKVHIHGKKGGVKVHIH